MVSRNEDSMAGGTLAGKSTCHTNLTMYVQSPDPTVEEEKWLQKVVFWPQVSHDLHAPTNTLYTHTDNKYEKKDVFVSFTKKYVRALFVPTDKIPINYPGLLILG